MRLLAQRAAVDALAHVELLDILAIVRHESVRPLGGCGGGGWTGLQLVMVIRYGGG